MYLSEIHTTMPQSNSSIFCNSPWYELHIYWDGSLGICCQESHKLYSSTDYNIATMSIADWFNSEPVKNFRQRILQSTTLSECHRCYREEMQNGMSKRIRSNQKSVIFTQAFDESFKQSPGYKHFNSSGVTTTLPIDLHIDLGNYCNLACKMCNPEASSRIASQMIKWGDRSAEPYLGADWTQNQVVWDNFKQQLLDIPNLNNIHFMGGETLLTSRFEDLVDWFIEHKRFNLCFSFVTNGTVFNSGLIDKLKLFQRIGIEVSIETTDEHNAYQRQGTDTNIVLLNIEKYIVQTNNTSITLTLRPAPSLLTVGYYDSLLQFALEKKLIIKSNLCISPRFLDAAILPTTVKKQYLEKYNKLLDQLSNVSVDGDYNASDPTNYQVVIKEQALTIKNVLGSTAPTDADFLLEKLVEHCRKWDSVYHLDARKLYPELIEVWDKYAY